MPRDFLTLADLHLPVVPIVCEPCGRREGHSWETLAARYGREIKLPELLARLVADCPKSKPSASIYDRCKALYAPDSRIGSRGR